MSRFIILKSGIDLFKKNRDDFWKIYYEAFTQPPYDNQYINIDEEEPWLINLFEKWHAVCYYAFLENSLVGFLVSAPSSYDSKLPEKTWINLNRECCTSIAELAISRLYQNQGIAKQLLKYVLSDRESKTILVRTNKTANIARRLYEKNGFVKLCDFEVKNRLIENGFITGVLTPKSLYANKFCPKKVGDPDV